MKTLYLAGPIYGCDDDQAKDWRRDVTTALRKQYHILDPLQRGDYRGREAANVLEIVRGDLNDIANSDVILALCERPSWGTAMELWAASEMGKSIITVADNGSPWIRYVATKRVAIIWEAIALLREVA